MRTMGVNIRLRLIEAKFLQAYLAGANQTDAYLVVRPNVSRQTAGARGCLIMKRIREKVPWKDLLEACDLGEIRLIAELRKRLEAKKTDDADNTTRMRATELLAEMLGKKKADIGLVPGTELVIRYQAIEPGIVNVDESRDTTENGTD